MYTIKQAALRTGVGVSLLRAWQRRYGVIDPARTPSGYRLYDDEAIARLIAMRRLVDAGWSAAQAAATVRTFGAGAADTELGVQATDPAVAGRRDGVALDLVTAARSYVPAAIESSLDELFGQGSYEAVIDDHILPAVAALGTAWVAGSLDIAGEHLASAAVLRRLAERFDHAASTGTGEPVIVGLPAGARHEIGVLAFAVALRRRGVNVIYLGPDVPASSWVEAARESAAAMAVIGIPRAADAEAGMAVLDAIERGIPRTRTAFGGPGARLDPETVAASALGRAAVLPDRVVEAAAQVVAMLAGARIA